jgi:hypothetical protein
VFVFYSFDKESLEKELNEKEISFEKKESFIVIDKKVNENNIKNLFLLAYKLRNLVDFGILVDNLEFLIEFYDLFNLEKKIFLKSKIKDKNFIDNIIKELKSHGFVIDKNSLFNLKIFDKSNIYLDLVKNNFTKRFYLKFFENKCLNPVLWQNFIYFLEIKKRKKIVNLKCCFSVFPIELIFYFLDFPGGFKRRDFSLLKIFNLENELNKIDEKAIKKLENFNEEIFCLADSTLDVDLSRKVARTIFLESKINFSRIDLFWVDWKFGEKEIDYFVSHIDNEREIDDYFYQAEYLARNIGLISREKNEEVHKLANKYKLEIIKEKKVKDFNFFYLK